MTTTIAQKSKKTIKSNREEARRREEIGEGKLGEDRTTENRGMGRIKKEKGGRDE